jgi:uncharacterized surface protein with fasciclin (FAS1) repeats
MRITLFSILGLLIVSISLIAWAQKNKEDSAQPKMTQVEQNMTVVEAADQIGATDFAKMVQQYGLENAFSKDGPYTIFAPSNTAIGALPQNIISELKDNKNMQTQLIGNHIYQGTLTQSDLSNKNLATVNGQKLNFTTSDGAVMVNGQKIVEGIQFNNGTIYMIDGVMLPPGINQ